MYWSFSWARILNVLNILDVYYFHHHHRCWPKVIQYLPTIMYLLHRMWTYPPHSGSMLCLRRNPLLIQCRSIIYDAGPTLIHHWVCCIFCTKKWHFPDAVSMLTHSLRRWPVIETSLGDCTEFSDCCIMLATHPIPESETPDNTIHWPDVDVMLGHRLRRWANIILNRNPLSS